MPKDLLHKSLQLIMKRQTNIISAAYVLMATMLFSQLLGWVRERMIAAFFGASNTSGVYLASSRLPDSLFQLVIAAALSSAFIPVFSDLLSKNREKEAQKMASTLLSLGALLFFCVSITLFIFAPFFLQLLNLGSGFSVSQIALMTNLMRIIIFGQLLFVLGSFLTALLQSYNHFFVPGIAAALYNLGSIIGILLFYKQYGIYSAAWGTVIGALLFVLLQFPLAHRTGFRFTPKVSLSVTGIREVLTLMVPRALSIAIFQLGAILILDLISFLTNSGRNYLIFNFAQTLMFAPVGLFGQTIAQAAFPVLAREKDKPEEFKATFLASLNQMMYLVMPISALLFVLRIPIVRLAFGAGKFDWAATVLTGSTLAYFSISIFAQALLYLVARAYYALHDTKTPLVVGGITLVITVGLGAWFVLMLHMGIESIAFASSVGSIANIVLLLFFLDRKTGGFKKAQMFSSLSKIFLATLFTGFALYIPIKLLDKLVFDTTRTINLLALTGISTLAGLTLYLFLTWLFNVKEAKTYLILFQKIGNWREILESSPESLDVHSNP